MISGLILCIGFILIAFMMMNGLAAFAAFILPPLLVMYLVQHWYDYRDDNRNRRKRLERSKYYNDDDVY